jgi:hypothetical protein
MTLVQGAIDENFDEWRLVCPTNAVTGRAIWRDRRGNRDHAVS